MHIGRIEFAGIECVFSYDDPVAINRPIGEIVSIISELAQIYKADAKLYEWQYDCPEAEVIFEDPYLTQQFELIVAYYFAQYDPETNSRHLYYVGDVNEFLIVTKSFVATTGYIVEAMNYQSLILFMKIYSDYLHYESELSQRQKLKQVASQVSGVRIRRS